MLSHRLHLTNGRPRSRLIGELLFSGKTARIHDRAMVSFSRVILRLGGAHESMRNIRPQYKRVAPLTQALYQERKAGCSNRVLAHGSQDRWHAKESLACGGFVSTLPASSARPCGPRGKRNAYAAKNVANEKRKWHGQLCEGALINGCSVSFSSSLRCFRAWASRRAGLIRSN